MLAPSRVFLINCYFQVDFISQRWWWSFLDESGKDFPPVAQEETLFPALGNFSAGTLAPLSHFFCLFFSLTKGWKRSDFPQAEEIRDADANFFQTTLAAGPLTSDFDLGCFSLFPLCSTQPALRGRNSGWEESGGPTTEQTCFPLQNIFIQLMEVDLKLNFCYLLRKSQQPTYLLLKFQIKPSYSSIKSECTNLLMTFSN